jgi:hypothetical protein
MVGFGGMCIMKAKYRLSRLVPKNHFCSFPIFREEPLISWTYTKSVLFTAYDVYRSNNYWLDTIIQSGVTLKEGLVELGFPKTNTLIADTGIFEIEAKKAGVARRLGININIELTNEQIFEAYKLSGADFFVSPDEIVLPQDKPEEIEKKLEIIKDNLLSLLDIVPSSKVIAVIQGHDTDVIDGLLDFYRENGIRYFAKGGVIPLYHYDKSLMEEVLKYTREATRTEWLHVFGLPRIHLLSYYLHELEYDSVDTSMLLYMTARRRYLEGREAIQVRMADFQACECSGCKNLELLKKSTRSSQFFTNLYIHNIITAAKLSQETAQNNMIRNTSSESSPPIEAEAPLDDPKRVSDEMIGLEWKTARESMNGK